MNVNKSIIEVFSLPSELFVAMQYIHDNFENISPNIRSKLNFIASTLLSLYAREDQKSFFSLIRAERDSPKDDKNNDFAVLENLSPEISTKVYFDTVTTLFPKSQLALNSLTKKGDLQIRSQTLKLWGERHVELNFGQQVLIIKKTSNRKPDKNLDLNTYSLRWLGEVKSRYCFALDSKTPKNHYKCFFIGSEIIEVARDWHESLRVSMGSCYISSFIEHRNKMNRLRRSISPQRKDQEEKKAKREAKTLRAATKEKEEYERRKINVFEDKPSDKNIRIPMLSSEDLEISGKVNIEKKAPGSAPHIQTSLFCFENANEEGKIDQSPTFKVLKEDCMKSPFVEKVNEISFQDYTNAKKVKMIRGLKLGELFRRKNQRKVRRKNKKKFVSSPKISKLIKKKQITCFFFVGTYEKHSSLHFFYPFYEFQGRKDTLKLPLSRNIASKDGSVIYLGTSVSLPRKNDNEGLRFENEVRITLNLHSFLNRSGWKKLINSENLQVFRSLNKCSRFKTSFCLPKSFLSVVPFFVNEGLIGLWNKDLESKTLLNGYRNGGITFYEKRKYFGKELEVVYLRHFFENKEYFIIHDQSIDFNDIDRKNAIKGDLIRRTIYFDKKYEENNNYTRILVEIEFLSKDLMKTLNMKHYLLQEYKNFLALKKVVKERTSMKRMAGGTMTIGLKRPVSCERKLQKNFKLDLSDEKRLFLPGKQSVYAGNNVEIGLDTKKIIDDTSIRRNNRCSEEIEGLYTKKENAWLGKIKENSKGITNFDMMLNEFFIDSSQHWNFTQKKGLLLKDMRLHKAQNRLIENLTRHYNREKVMPFSFINLEYPLIFNEPQTLLMKLLYPYVSSYDLLVKAADNAAPLDQMKWVLAFLVSLMRNSLFGLFPINSVVGENLKITLKNGVVFSAELSRISPRQAMVSISSLFFEVKATHEIDFILNKADIKIKTYKQMDIALRKAESSKFQVLQFPLLSIFDLAASKRTVHYDGVLLVCQKDANLSAVVNFGTHVNDFITDENTTPEREDCVFSGNIFKEFPIEEDIRENELLGTVGGMWLKGIKFDEEAFWGFKSNGTLLEQEAKIEGNGLSRKDWIEARLGNWENARKAYEAVQGREKMERWGQLKKNIKTSFY